MMSEGERVKQRALLIMAILAVAVWLWPVVARLLRPRPPAVAFAAGQPLVLAEACPGGLWDDGYQVRLDDFPPATAVPTAVVTPLASASPMVASPPVPTHTPDVTPAPNRPEHIEHGARVTTPTLLVASRPSAAILKAVLYGDRLALVVGDEQQRRCLWIVDLKASQAEPVAALYGPARTDPALSDRYVAWTENGYFRNDYDWCCGGDYQGAVIVYDLQARREIVRRSDDYVEGAWLSQAMAIWSSSYTLYAQPLPSGEPVEMVRADHISYFAAADDWLAFIRNGGGGGEHRLYAELTVINWHTGEERILGPVNRSFSDPDAAGQGGQIMWLKRFGPKEDLPGWQTKPISYELHLANFESVYSDRVLRAFPANGSHPYPAAFSGDLLVYPAHDGWEALNVRSGESFPLFPAGAGIGALQLAGQRLVWLGDDAPSGPGVYTANIVP
jgi:hypothetical protein